MTEYALALEYHLTIASRVVEGCDWCPAYFVRRRSVLIPAVAAESARRGVDSAELFADFAAKVHSRHEEASL